MTYPLSSTDTKEINMKLKQWTAFLLCGTLCFSLAGCKRKESENDQGQEPNAAITAVTEEVRELNLFARDALPENSYDGITLVIDSITAKAGEQNVPVRIMLFNNSGFINSGVRIQYADALQPHYNTEDNKTEYALGSVCEDFLSASVVDPAKHLIGFVSAGAEAATADGIVFTIYFDIPSDAKSGTIYPLTLDVQDFKANYEEQLDPKLIQGGIQIQ